MNYAVDCTRFCGMGGNCIIKSVKSRQSQSHFVRALSRLISKAYALSNQNGYLQDEDRNLCH